MEGRHDREEWNGREREGKRGRGRGRGKKTVILKKRDE